MTRTLPAVLLLCLLLLGCGRYGSPVRTGTGVSGVTAPHAASCNDPKHDHADEEQQDSGKP